jgi:predicted TIM-barrel fold metal-dependent hydrolase
MPGDHRIIDVNVNLGRWPTRRSPLDELAKLVAKLQSQGVVEAWTGSFDGVFHTDLTEVNHILAEACTTQNAKDSPVGPLRLVAFGEINPLLPTWEAELDRCMEIHRMAGIRLHPNYHGYALDHPEFAKVLKAAAERNLIVALPSLMEDERMMHPLLRVPPVDLKPLLPLLAQNPNLKLVLLNSLGNAARGELLDRLLDGGQVYVEIAMLEGVGGIENLLKNMPVERILFGSNAPSFYFESSLLKLQESPLPAAHRRAILHDNARRLLAR